MTEKIEASSDVTNVDSTRERVTHWLLLGGNRLVIAAGMVLAVTFSVAALTSLRVVAVGPSSAVATLFGSGITSGIVTLMTIALSVNQLILSRVFGSPNKLDDRLEGTTDLRERVEELADEPSSPNDPSAFLAMTGTAIATRASRLQSALEGAPWTPPADVVDAVSEVRAYGQNIDSRLESDRSIHNTLTVVLGVGYALNVAAVHQIRNQYDDELTQEVRAELEALESLLRAVAVTRQFFKTIALQEDLARLSRYVVYTGLVAFTTAVVVTLLYQSNSTTVPLSYLPLIVSAGVGIASSPVALFSSYVLRSATIAHQTLSVGPFIPPQER